MSIEKRLFSYDRRAGVLLYLAVGAGFLAAALFVFQSWLISHVVNRVFLEHQGLSEVVFLLGWMLALLPVRAGLVWEREALAQRSASRVKSSLRGQLTSHLLALGPAYIQNQRSGELVNTIVEGIETLDEFITQFLPARFLAGLVPVMVFLVVLALDPWTTLVLLVAGPFLLLLLALIGGQAREITARRFLELSWMSAFFLDILQGIATLKMFGRSREQTANIQEIGRHYGNITMEVLQTAFQTSLVMEWAATAATALVALEISLRLMSHSLAFDRGLTVLLLTPEFFLPLRQMALKYHSGAAGKAAAGRIFAILDTPPAFHQAALEFVPQALPALSGHCEVCFDKVSFAYEGGQRPALEDFSLRMPHGQTTALVGPTGAGKTTVANLLLRFIDPDSGVITVNQQPLQAFERSAWRSQVAWVPQLPHFFYGSVGQNILLARPAASPGEIVAAAQAANAHEFILSLPHGYETLLGEQGARLSGGQAQRIAIARAILKDAPFLILDEFTAHLDSTSEALIQEALFRLMHGRTVLIIAHRLRLVYAANQILVMDKGRVVQSGDHLSLVARDGLYQQLVASYERGGF